MALSPHYPRGQRSVTGTSLRPHFRIDMMMGLDQGASDGIIEVRSTVSEARKCPCSGIGWTTGSSSAMTSFIPLDEPEYIFKRRNVPCCCLISEVPDGQRNP